jgi:hypothetical protein
MTYTDPTPRPTPPPALAPTAPHAAAWEQCDHCQAPLAERQRYCVACGAHRPHADDPAARWFVESARRSRAAEAAPGAAPTDAADSASRLRHAFVLALLPLVAALGIMVGRGGGDHQLIDALKAQKAPIVNVVGGSGSGSAATTGGGSGSSGSAHGGHRVDPVKGDVIAHTRYGTARRLTGASVTPQQIDESRRALQHIVDSKGRAYVEQQRNLPDEIVVP